MKRKQQSVVIELTAEQAKRLLALGRWLWPEDEEDADLEGVCRWLLLAASHVEGEDSREELRRLLLESERATAAGES